MERAGRWVEVLHSMVSRAGQKTLPSAVPSQSLMLGSQHSSAKNDRMEATSSAVRPLLSGSEKKGRTLDFWSITTSITLVAVNSSAVCLW